MNTVDATTLLSWIQQDYVALWQIIDAVESEGGADPAELYERVIASIEGPLRKGWILVGHVYHGEKQFNEIDLPADDVLRLVREALPRVEDDFVNVDLWIDATPAGDRFLGSQVLEHERPSPPGPHTEAKRGNEVGGL